VIETPFIYPSRTPLAFLLRVIHDEQGPSGGGILYRRGHAGAAATGARISGYLYSGDPLSPTRANVAGAAVPDHAPPVDVYQPD